MYKTIASKVRSMYDGYRLLQTTWKPHVFYSRLRKVEALAEELQAHEGEVSFRHKPSEILKELRENRAEYERRFVDRYEAVLEEHLLAVRSEKMRVRVKAESLLKVGKVFDSCRGR